MKLPRYNPTTVILWVVYICLLLVLLPHTAWAFYQMEPAGRGGWFTAWVAAIAFEASIAVMTHKLSKHMEQQGKKKGWKRFAAMYLNAFAFGLLAATLISALANLAHAVEFGRTLAIFAKWGIPPGVYSVAFGGILPVVSLVFARVLSNVADTEEAPNPELETAKSAIRELKDHLKQSEVQRKAAEDRARLAEERFGAVGDLVRRMFSDDKRERILATYEWRPKLTGSAIAVITEASPAYVSEVLEEVKQ